MKVSKNEKNTSLVKDEDLVALLPFYATPRTLLIGDKLPCHGSKITNRPIEYILSAIKRQVWVEGLYARKSDLDKIKRYKNPDHTYKNDFDKTQFFQWVKAIEENTALCDMENRNLGKGIFVPPGKKLVAGTFIPASGIIKLNPTKEELETKVHCSALQNLDSRNRQIAGLIDPGKQGGILDFINHAPNLEELSNFKFKNSFDTKNVATANLRSVIKFYNGYAIMGLIVIKSIVGGKYGKQLLWSYALHYEYIPHHQSKFNNQTLLLFYNPNELNGQIIDSSNYVLREIAIYIDMGELVIKKIASLTRWELMESPPHSPLFISIQDPYSSNQSEPVQSSILYGFLQTYLIKNPSADRIILKVPVAKRKNPYCRKEKQVNNASHY